MESKVGTEVCDVPALYPGQTAGNQLDAARTRPADVSKGAGHAP